MPPYTPLYRASVQKFKGVYVWVSLLALQLEVLQEAHYYDDVKADNLASPFPPFPEGGRLKFWLTVLSNAI